MLKHKEYDTVVIGAGLAGSIAAKKIAEAGYRVLLVEKRQEIGNAVRCAEGVSEKWLLKHTGLKPHWISHEVKGAILRSPSGKSCKMHYADKGYILDRKVFDYELAVAAGNAGAEVYAKTAATAIQPLENEEYNFLVTLQGYIEEKVKTKLIIAADGVESKIGRMLGINTTVAPQDIEFCMQCTLDNIDITHNYVEMIGGNDLAPGGYVWIFPKGERSANVGLGVIGSRSTKEKNANYYLSKFIKQNFPNGTISRIIPGADAVCKPLEIMSGKGFMIAGDAARLANPLTGAGIGNALESGAIAGETAIKALNNNNFSSKFLKNYDKKVYKSIGSTTKYFHAVKDAVIKMSDEDMEKMIDSLSKLNPDKITLKKVLEIGFKNNKLVVSIIKKLIFS